MVKKAPSELSKELKEWQGSLVKQYNRHFDVQTIDSAETCCTKILLVEQENHKKVTKILKVYAKLRKQVISLCCKIVVIIGYVKLIERRRNHECIR